MAFTGIFGVSKFSDKFMEFLSRAKLNVFVLDILSSRLIYAKKFNTVKMERGKHFSRCH